jgi:hypothetical protein
MMNPPMLSINNSKRHLLFGLPVLVKNFRFAFEKRPDPMPRTNVIPEQTFSLKSERPPSQFILLARNVLVEARIEIRFVTGWSRSPSGALLFRHVVKNDELY